MDYSKLTIKQMHTMIKTFKKQQPKIMEEFSDYQELYKAVKIMEVFYPKICKDLYDQLK